MKRISRHTVVAVVVACVASLGGLGVAVAAFGQDTPAPASTTDPTSGYAPTTPTTVTVTTPAATAPAKGDDGSGAEDKSGGGSKPSRTSGTPVASPPQPSRTTRDAPTTLAFTGADPIVLGGAGALLMLAGLGLHRHRRRAASLRI